MQVFRELRIRGTPQQLCDTRDWLEKSLRGSWSRDEEAERHTKQLAAPHGRKPMCFRCQKIGNLPAVTVILVATDEHCDRVANIIASDRDLARSEFNAILVGFFRNLVEPAAAQTGAHAELTEANVELENWLTPPTAEKLRVFSELANKRTGATYPTDRERWFDFIVSAHREGAGFSATELAQWLQETGGWSQDWANELSIQYERARGLLEYAESQAVGV